MRLLLSDLQTMDGERHGTDAVLVTWPEDGFVGRDGHGIVLECDPLEVGDTSVTNLLVRPYFFEDRLEAPLAGGRPIQVVAYWRTRGRPWTPAAIRAAERLRFGVGGALTATLIPLQDAEVVNLASEARTRTSPGRRSGSPAA